MPTLLKHTVFNELSNARNTNNMAILQVMFNHDKEIAPTSLGKCSNGNIVMSFLSTLPDFNADFWYFCVSNKTGMHAKAFYQTSLKIHFRL